MPSAHILHVPVIEQATGSTCGGTCLAAVAQYLGKHISPHDFGEYAETTPEGTDHEQMILGAQRSGATVFAKRHAAPADLVRFVSRGLPVVVGWWSNDAEYPDPYDPKWSLQKKKRLDCGHYSVVTGVTPTGFVFMDPQLDDTGHVVGICEKTTKLWKTIWYDTNGNDYHRVNGWFMALNYEGAHFATKKNRGHDYPALPPPPRRRGR